MAYVGDREQSMLAAEGYGALDLSLVQRDDVGRGGRSLRHDDIQHLLRFGERRHLRWRAFEAGRNLGGELERALLFSRQILGGAATDFIYVAEAPPLTNAAFVFGLPHGDHV